MAETIESLGKIDIDKIKPNDPRVKKASVKVNGHDWHYLDAAPEGQQKGVIVLVHGFPDLSFAWRYQIPMLTQMGLRCIAIDCMGYSDTGASKDLHAYTYKSHADAIAGICAHIGASSIILGGHDWGGAVVWRVSQWLPELVSHVLVVCIPFFPVSEQYISTAALVAGPLPQFGYQLQLGSEDHKIEKIVTDEKMIRRFLSGVYGGKTASGRKFLTPENGVDLDVLRDDEIAPSPLLNEEELDFYVSQFAKTGMNGPCNWYRLRKIMYEEDLGIPKERRNNIQQPTLFISALGDSILKPEMAKGMAKAIPNLTVGEVNASHWALWHTPKETNEHIKKWIENVFLGGKSKI